MQVDLTKAYTSDPLQYDYTCPNCGQKAIGTIERDKEDINNDIKQVKYNKYYVSCENMYSGVFGGLFTSTVDCFEVTIAENTPVNAQRFYDIINKDRDHKTGKIVAWSKIE